jgi:hypothetical protein
VAVPLRSGKVTAKFQGGDMLLEGVTVAETGQEDGEGNGGLGRD